MAGKPRPNTSNEPPSNTSNDLPSNNSNEPPSNTSNDLPSNNSNDPSPNTPRGLLPETRISLTSRASWTSRTSRALLLSIFLVIGSILADRLFSFSFDIYGVEAVRVGFRVLPVLFGSIWLGPWWGMFIGGGSDLLGFTLKSAAPYLMHITLVEMLRGFLPGLLARFSGDITRLRNLALQIGVTQIVCSIILMPLVLYQAFGVPIIDNVTTRIFVQAFTIPLYVGIVYVLIKQLQSGQTLRKSEERAQRQRSALAGLVLDDVVVTGEVPAAIRRITEVLSDTIGVERAGIWTFNEEGTKLQCLCLFEAGKREHSKGAALKAEAMSRYFETILKESRIYTEDARKDPRTSELTEGYLKPLGITSLLDAGIIIEGKLKGVVSVEHVGEPRKWHADEEAFVSTIATMVGQVFINAERKQIYNSLQFQLQFEKIISEISSTFVNLPSHKLDEGINHALQLTGEFFNVDRSYVFQFSADGQRISNTHEWCAEGIEPQMDMIQDYPVNNLPWWAEQIKNNDYVFIADVNNLPADAEAEKEEFQRQGIQSLLSVPMLKDNKLVGFFGFDSVREKRVWAEEQASFLKVIAGILVNAFEKTLAEQKIRDYTMELEHKGAELEQTYQQLDKEIDKARRVHEKTLPKTLPRVEGISFATHYQPAAKVGGDFYDVIKKDNKTILYLSDVIGHGLDSAMLSVFVKNTINSYVSLSPEDRLTPEHILRHLFQQYSQDNYPEDYFICIFLAVLDLESAVLTYTGAGFQNAPLVNLNSGEQLLLTSKGLPISTAFPSKMLNLKEKSLKLAPGDTIMFTTDGLFEIRVNGEMYQERAEKLFYKNSGLPPEAIVQAINEDFCQFNNGFMQGDDDITYLVMQVNPDGKKSHCLELPSRLEELDRLRREVLQFMPEDEEVKMFMVCLHELVANAMEHGNRLDPEKAVFVELTATKYYIQGTVEDQGEGFNWRAVVERPLDFDGIAVRGRGIALTRRCCDHFFYNDKGNRATFIINSSGKKPQNNLS